MLPSFSYGFLLLAGLCFLLPSSKTQNPQHSHDISHLRLPGCQKVALAITNMSFSLFQEIARRSNHTNILFAPLRIAAGFTMVSLGVKGDTHKEIMHGLRLNLPGMSETDIQKCFHNILPILHQPLGKSAMTGGMSLFIHSRLNLEDKFLQDIKQLYHLKVISMNFTDSIRAKTLINRHIRKKTFTEIVEVFKNLKNDTDLALVNFMCFHGKWYDEVKSQRVVKEEFQVDEKIVMMVPMVNRLGLYYVGWVKELSSLVLIQLQLGSAMAFFIMPDRGKMQQVEQMLTYQHLAQIRKSFTLRPAKLHFPVLSISAMYDLESVLSPLGITHVFRKWADFSGLTRNATLRRSKFVHKAVLTFDDKGTGASGNAFFTGRAWRRSPSFRFNRPFLIFIKSEVNNFPLFVGKVMNPEG